LYHLQSLLFLYIAYDDRQHSAACIPCFDNLFIQHPSIFLINISQKTSVFISFLGFGVFLFQCGDVRSSEWCVKNSLTLLFKRTISRLFIRYQTYVYKTNGFTSIHLYLFWIMMLVHWYRGKTRTPLLWNSIITVQSQSCTCSSRKNNTEIHP
jgi:hypothetical protein